MTAVAIDGPAGAGKSTIARAVAKALGWVYADTGAMYRAVALAALERGIDTDDEQALEDLVTSLDIEVSDDKVMVDGADVTERIRDAGVTEAVSSVSAHPRVRAALVQRQRRLADSSHVVMEGRDIGTTVLPDAAVKVFLTASLETRARRRCDQLGLPADSSTREEIERSLAARDEADSGRAASPLTQPPDAVVFDTTDKDVATLSQEIAALVGDVVDGR